VAPGFLDWGFGPLDPLASAAPVNRPFLLLKACIFHVSPFYRVVSSVQYKFSRCKRTQSEVNGIRRRDQLTIDRIAI
jgi:hypothetical protein